MNQQERPKSYTRLYVTWYAMRHRCSYPNHQNWKYYGGKGIKVCDEWQTFEVFRDWAYANGYADDLTIDRLNPDGDYEPSNCEWVTRSENVRRMMAARYPNGSLRSREIGLRPKRIGELHHAAKLTETDIRRIRADERGDTAIARDYGVGQPTIWKIRNRRSWRHVD